MSEIDELRSILRRISERLDKLEPRRVNTHRIRVTYESDPDIAVISIGGEGIDSKPIPLACIGEGGFITRIMLTSSEVAEAVRAGVQFEGRFIADRTQT
jgi:hypothetical protein